MTAKPSNLQIDSGRLWGAIHETAKFGATAKGGVKRLAHPFISQYSQH